MKLSKSKKLSLAAWIVALAVYIFLVFLLSKPENRVPSFWIGFSFTIVAFALTLYIVFKGIKADDLLFNYPLYKLCVSYYVVQLIFGSVFIIFVITGIVWVIAIEVVILAIFVILFFLLNASNEIITKQEKEIKVKRQVINELKDKLDYINHQVEDKDVKDAIEELAEQVRFSDPMSNASVIDLDNTIATKIDELDSIDKNDNEKMLAFINELSFTIKQRNTKLKNSK